MIETVKTAVIFFVILPLTVMPVIEKIIMEQRPSYHLLLVHRKMQIFTDQKALFRNIDAVTVYGDGSMLNMIPGSLKLLRIQDIRSMFSKFPVEFLMLIVFFL